jgi:hypothetical protein
MDFARTELLVKNQLEITNNQQNLVVNFHPDFMASTHTNFFQGQMARGLSYWPNHSRKTQES